MSSIIETITGKAVAVRGNDIDTDRIIPARFLRCVSFDGLGEHAFEDDRRDPAHPFNQAKYEEATILIANQNFGCGSSREHAPQSLVRWGKYGIKAFIAESFAEIFFGNCVSLGVPCVTASAQDIAALQQAVETNPSLQMTVDLKDNSVCAGDLRISVTMPAGPRGQLLDGSWDALGQLLDGQADIRRVDAALPY